MNGRQLKAHARKAMAGKWKFGIFAVLVTWVVSSIFETPLFIMESGLEHAWQIGATALVAGPIATGISWLFLDIWDKKDVMYNTAFAPIRNYWKVVLVTFIVYVVTFAGMFLLLVPGIIFYLTLSQSIYILKEHPQMGVMEVLNTSRLKMKGNKRRLVGVILSFAGYLVPPVIATMVAVFFFTESPVGAWIFLGSVIYIIGVAFYLIPIFSTTMGGFYRETISK